MAQWFDLIAQVSSDEDGALGKLVWVAILFVLVLGNALKDKWVEREEKQKAEKSLEKRPLKSPPKMRSGTPALPTARVIRSQGTAQPSPAAPVVVPVGPSQVKLAEPPAPQIVPAPPAPQPVPVPVPQIARTPQSVQRGRVAGVDVHSADPTVDMHGADPRVRMRRAEPQLRVRSAEPGVSVHDLAAAVEVESAASGFFGTTPTPEDMRRAVVLSEILRPPLALRGRSGLLYEPTL